MYFQIEKVVLWSKDPQKEPRTINFELNKVNLITGASKTGKSSIIPIIDYCMGSSKCSIPVNTIRDNTSWYGVQIKTATSRILIARRDPGEQQSTTNAFFIEADEIELPPFIEKQNININHVKDKLNELSGISNVNFDFYNTGRLDKAKTGLRDMAAFNYQPQNIVANPNALFYKADSAEHKAKLKTILPYVLGAQSNDDLEKIHRLKAKEEEFNKVDRKYQKLKKQNQDWISKAQAYVIKAVEFGLVKINKDVDQHSPEQLLRVLKGISNKDVDPATTAANIKFSSVQERSLTEKSKTTSQELAKVKHRLVNLSSMREATDKHSGVAHIKRNRLSLSKWLLEKRNDDYSLFSEPNEVKKLVLEPLAKAFEDIEPDLAVPEQIQGVLSRERIYLEKELTRLASELKDIKDQLKILRGDSKKYGYDTFSVGRFVGQVHSALELMGATEDETELAKEHKKLRLERDELRRDIDPAEIRRRTDLQLQKVNSLATKWLPSLDTENPDAPVSLCEKELSVKINNGRRHDYLWEIGSGANWVSYHVAISLALHQHFHSLDASPVPNYIIYDQPSQVYFPSKLSNGEQGENSDLALFESDEDIKQVQKIFNVFNQVIEKTDYQMQIIVLDHAPSRLVTDISNGHLVEEWRDGVKLVPAEWL